MAKRSANKSDATSSKPPPSRADTPAIDTTGAESPIAGLPPVAGIVASAGGLEAFKRLLDAMPLDTGIAFVVVPHLDPTRASLMVQLLATHTRMPIVEAAEGVLVQANHVYVAPPNKYLSIAGGVLHLKGPVDRPATSSVLDIFLRSLANDLKEKAICIILSGSGSQGTLGLRAVKAAGGLAIVQDPTTAGYPPMPQSAAETGLADYVLPVEAMPEKLCNYVRHDYVNGETPVVEDPEFPEACDQILALLRGSTKLDFRLYRKKMLVRRIERRMSLSQFVDLPEYLAFLRERPEEVKRLANDLLINVTSFFRDPEAWHALETQSLTPLLDAKDSDTPIRVWSVGCSTGEEAYSLGITLLERLASVQRYNPIQVFATDIDDDALEFARKGIYPDSIAVDVSAERLARYFTRLNSFNYQVSKHLRELVTFARQNALTDPPFSRIDLVVCRNMLIYLEPEAQKRILDVFHFALVEGGVLFLGSSETVGKASDRFVPTNPKWRIYRHVGLSLRSNLQFPGMDVELLTKSTTVDRPQLPLRLAELAQSFLLRRFALACAVVDRKFEVLHFAGPTSDYLVQPSGAPTRDLLALARPGLEPKLRIALQRAVRENAPQSIKDVIVRLPSGPRRVYVEVEPLNLTKQTEGLLLVAFQEQSRSGAEPKEETPRDAKSETASAEPDAVRQLEQQLESTRDDLQHAIEEMESSNEELKASNEEVTSMNEELQSSNEELESSKEELQSLNEELNTVNNQLSEKVQDLELANNDMANLFNCTDIPTIFLGAGLKIKKMTSAATRLFKLIPTDVGRPLGDVASRVDDPSLFDDAKSVLRELTPRECEVRADDGHWFVRRIVPYRTLDNRIEGVAITFVDVTARKKEADAAVRRLAAIVESAADAVISKDLMGTVQSWNRGAETLYGFTAAEIVGKSIRLTIPHDRRAEWDDIMGRVGRGEQISQMETERVCKDGKRLAVAITYSPLKDYDGVINGVSVISRDISERKRGEAIARENQERLAADLVRVTRLQQVSARLGQTDHPDSLLLEILDAAIALTGADMGNVQTLDDGDLKIAVSRGLEQPFLKYFESVHGHAACGTAIERGERIVVEDVHTSPIFVGTADLDVMLGAGIRGVQSTPLLTRSGELVGVISTHWRRPAQPSAAQLHDIDILARQAADWIDRVRGERSLRESREKIQAILNAAADAIITIDKQGIIVTVNRAAEIMFGFAADEMVGQNVKMLMPSPYRDRHDGYLSAYLRTREKHVIGIGREVEGRHKNGRIFPVELAISEVNHSQFYTGILRDITTRKQLEREVLEIASLQQRRIGQDLHDSVAQELTALELLAGDLLETLKTDPANCSTLAKQIANGLRRSKHELRDVVRGMLPVMVDHHGLMAALTDLVERTNAPGKAACTFTCPESIPVADNLVATHLFLIAQEAVHNAVRHAQPAKIEVELRKTETGLLLSIRDDGAGLPPAPATKQGLGQRIMRNRAAIIGATLTVEPTQPRGTTVTCTLRTKLHGTGQTENAAGAGPDRR